MIEDELALAIQASGHKFPGFVYAIRCGDRAVKFGVAESVHARFLNLQSANCERLQVAASIFIDDRVYAFERRVHAAMRRHRIRGEWFLLRPASLELIKLMKQGDRTALEIFLDGQLALSVELAVKKYDMPSPADKLANMVS